MKKLFLFILAALFILSCSDNNLIAPIKTVQPTTPGQTATQSSKLINTLFVSTTGNDGGDGSSTNPYKTLKYAVSQVPVGQTYTLQVSAGTFVENGSINVPPGVTINGAGITQTILKAASSFYYHPAVPGYAVDKFLISLVSTVQTNGNQSLSNFSIDGDTKQLHGGIYVKDRNTLTISNVKVQNTNFTGIWLWDVQDSKITTTQLVNCSWGSTSFSSGALNLGNITRVEVDQLTVDENTGYGIKAIGPSGNNNILNSIIHDSHISVSPVGLWNNGSAPNIAIELWQVNLVGNQIYNTYVDNTISLVNSNALPSTGIQTIRLYNNTIDMDTRAHGAGYGLELTIHDAEIDHNYFFKGTQGIANWSNPMKNWNIHHNTFYALQGVYPGEVVRSQSSGLHNVKLYNNTVEFASDKTMNVVGLYGGTSDNVDVRNNLIINNSTGTSYYPIQFVHLENGAILNTLTANNNLLYKLPIGTVAGVYAGNLASDPQLTNSGSRPGTYYLPKAVSPVIDRGLDVGYAYSGSAPDIGAFEYGGLANQLPQVSLTSPANNSTFALGASVTLGASATDSDGTISKVEFFLGATKLGEDLTSPYSLVWTATAGTNMITAIATDNNGAATTSSPSTVTVGGGNTATLNLDSSTASLTGMMTNGADPSAQNGNFFFVAPGNGKNYMIPPPGQATFSFQLPAAGNYVVWARVKSASANNEAFNMYNGAGKWFTWSAGLHSTWTWVKITDSGATAMFPFVKGTNNFIMGWMDDNVQVDQVTVSNDLSLAL